MNSNLFFSVVGCFQAIVIHCIPVVIIFFVQFIFIHIIIVHIIVIQIRFFIKIIFINTWRNFFCSIGYRVIGFSIDNICISIGDTVVCIAWILPLAGISVWLIFNSWFCFSTQVILFIKCHGVNFLMWIILMIMLTKCQLFRVIDITVLLLQLNLFFNYPPF